MNKEIENKVLEDLQNRICNHIARGDKDIYSNIKKYHMKKIKDLSDYMIAFLEYGLIDARFLNQLFYTAVKELGIDLNDMYCVPVDSFPSSLEETRKMAM